MNMSRNQRDNLGSDYKPKTEDIHANGRKRQFKDNLHIKQNG